MKLIKSLSISALLKAHAFTFGVVLTIFAFVFFATGWVVANGETMGPNDVHVVDLYVDGKETIVPTRAATVGDFLTKASVVLYENDLVEPSKDSLITSDNYRIQIYRARPVTIIDGESKTRILTPESSAKLIVERAGITVYPEDNLQITMASNFVEDGMFGEKLIIDRATPISVSLYSTAPTTYRTHALTVGDFFKERGIVPESGATVTPGADTAISADTQIYISKMGKNVVSVEQEIPFEVQASYDSSMFIGQNNVTTNGVNGKKQVVYEIETKDGIEVGRKIIQEIVTQQPVTQVVVKGSKVSPASFVSTDKYAWMSAAGIAESDYYYVDFIIGHESGWRYNAWNRSGSGAYGLCQALPASKMASAGSDYMDNPVTQLKWCNGYAGGRYGGWYGAYLFWIGHSWW
jgi:resuscitation-promoting factor RpfB